MADRQIKKKKIKSNLLLNVEIKEISQLQLHEWRKNKIGWICLIKVEFCNSFSEISQMFELFCRKKKTEKLELAMAASFLF